jgi:phosphate transport system protein
MRNSFDKQLEELNNELIIMGALCENVIAMAAKALIDGDVKLAKSVVESDYEIDQCERKIETLCMKLLLQQQPVAKDLRTISSALKMITDMERIGDQSADIAEIVTMANITASDETLHISDMARAVIKMVTESIDAFVKKDTALAKSVIEYDDVVDNLFNKVKTALAIRFKSGGEMEYALDLLMIAKYFERIGDHATNIAEWVLYSVTGRKE